MEQLQFVQTMVSLPEDKWQKAKSELLKLNKQVEPIMNSLELVRNNNPEAFLKGLEQVNKSGLQ